MPAPRHSRRLTLWFPLALFAAAVRIIAVTTLGPVRDWQFRHRSRATVLALQRAVQDYHVALEFYPKKSPMSGAELTAFLAQSGHLPTPPINPWTGTAYSTGQPDGIVYRTDELAETYSLEASGRDLAPERPLWQLDSTGHRSLE